MLLPNNKEISKAQAQNVFDYSQQIIQDLPPKALQQILGGYESDIDIKRHNLQDLKDFLMKKRQFLLNLLENPNLLEHESFTNLLWAVFHLTEELTHRKNLSALLKTDGEHLANDIKRVERLLVSQWLAYMKHLKSDYPYLFSLAMRTNPFDASASVEVK